MDISYRSALEVQQFLSPQDILKSTSLVSVSWNRGAESLELWSSLCALFDYGDVKEKHISSYKRFFRLQAHRASIISVLNYRGVLKFFNCASETWTECKKALFPLRLDQLMLLFDGSMVGSSRTEVFRADAYGHTQYLPELNSPREMFGLAISENRIFTFGGENQLRYLVCTAEKLEFGSKTWDVLPDMQNCRASFTPCVYKKMIILYSVKGIVECFDTVSWRYANLSYKGNIGDSRGIFSYATDIYILGKNRVTAITQGGKTLVYKLNGLLTGNCKTTPVFVHNKIYFIDDGMQFLKIKCLDLARLDIAVIHSC